MSNYLVLDTNYVQSGLGTLTFNVPATVSAFQTPVSNIPFQVRCQVSVPQAVAQGSSAGSGLDAGDGVTGGAQGIGQGSNLSLGNGGTGLGCGPGAASSNASSSGYTQAALVLSALSVVVNLNGSPVYTAPAVAGDQEMLSFVTPGILCTAADVITVVFSSAGAPDNQLNAIKANVAVAQGE